MSMVPMIMVGIGLASGIGSLTWAWFVYQRGQRAKGWPSVDGTVTLSSVRESSSRDSDGRTSVSYYPDIEFNYVVGGKPLSSQRVTVGPSHSRSASACRAIATRYPEKAKVKVYYDPQDSSYAVLETSTPTVVLAALVGGGVFGFVFAGVAFYFTRSMP